MCMGELWPKVWEIEVRMCTCAYFCSSLETRADTRTLIQLNVQVAPGINSFDLGCDTHKHMKLLCAAARGQVRM